MQYINLTLLFYTKNIFNNKSKLTMIMPKRSFHPQIHWELEIILILEEIQVTYQKQLIHLLGAEQYPIIRALKNLSKKRLINAKSTGKGGKNPQILYSLTPRKGINLAKQLKKIEDLLKE